MKTLDQMLAQLSGLRDQAAKQTTLELSIAEQAKANGALIQDLRAQLAQAGTDPAKLQQLGDLMDSLAANQLSEDNAQAAVQAALANTDQAPSTGDQPGGTDTTGTGSGTETGQTGQVDPTAGASTGTSTTAADPNNPSQPAPAPATPAPAATDPNAPKPAS